MPATEVSGLNMKTAAFLTFLAVAGVVAFIYGAYVETRKRRGP